MPHCCDRPPDLVTQLEDGHPLPQQVDPDSDDIISFYKVEHRVPLCAFTFGEYISPSQGGGGNEYLPSLMHDRRFYQSADFGPTGGGPSTWSNEIRPDTFWRTLRVDYVSGRWKEWNYSCDGQVCSLDYQQSDPPPTGRQNIISIALSNEIVPDWRILHDPTASGYLKLWLYRLSERILDTGVDYVRVDLDPYVWAGAPPYQSKPIGIYGTDPNTGDPNNPDAPCNIIVSAPIDVSQESDLRYSNRLKVKKFSFLPGYEPPPYNPDDPDDPANYDPTLYVNGYPPPTGF